MTLVSISRASPLCRLSFQLRKTICALRQNMPSRTVPQFTDRQRKPQRASRRSVARHLTLNDTSGRRRPSQRHNYADPLGRDIKRGNQALNPLDLQTCFINALMHKGKIDRLCGLVVRVSGYRYRGPGFDSRRYQIF